MFLDKFDRQPTKEKEINKTGFKISFDHYYKPQKQRKKEIPTEFG